MDFFDNYRQIQCTIHLRKWTTQIVKNFHQQSFQTKLRPH